MRISLKSPVDINYTEVGFGQAIAHIYKSLSALKHTVSIDNRLAPVQLNWMQPHLFESNRFQYQILYFPWESTELPPNWVKICNSASVDEVWATSEWCADIYRKNGITKDVKVFEHGISSVWTPKLRKQDGPIKYLIVDAAANRKGWQEAFDAFRAVFGSDSEKATLTIKSRQRSLIKWKDSRGFNHSPDELSNVTINLNRISDEEMVQLYLDHDVLIFPSYGEGFGLIPHQALATGMITITTQEWAPYKHYLGDMALRSNYGNTKWPGEHSGQVCYPDKAHLEELIRKSYDDFDEQSKKFYRQSWEYHERYDWEKLTRKAFEDLDKIF